MSSYFKSPTYMFAALLAFLCGAMISDQIHFFAIFEGELFLDWVLLTGTAGIAAAIGLSYLHIRPLTLLAIQIGVLCLSTIAFELSFLTYGIGEIASFTPYFIVLAAGLALGASLNDLKKKGYAWYLIIGAILVAGMIYQSYRVDRSWNNYLLIIGLLLLFWRSYAHIDRRRVLLFILSLPLLVVSVVYSNTAVPGESQHRYYDKVVYSKSGAFQQIDITEWKGNHWFYYNNVNQFSSIDEWLYAEPMAHSVMELSQSDKRVLVIGGENGIVVREILKHKVDTLDIIPIDLELIKEASINPLFTNINKNALLNGRVRIRHSNAFRFLYANENNYDVIVIDVPDPLDLELNQYYSKEFYELCFNALHENGFIITQAGSPYFATRAFLAVEKAIATARFATLPLHNQVLSLGEWGWIIGSKSIDKASLLSAAKKLKFNHLETRWINNEAMHLMVSFGKPYLITDSVAINTLKNPVIYSYYKSGTWKFKDK